MLMLKQYANIWAVHCVSIDNPYYYYYYYYYYAVFNTPFVGQIKMMKLQAHCNYIFVLHHL